MGGSNSLTQIRDQKIKQRNTQIKHRVQMVGKIMEELKVNNQLANQITNSSATQLVEMLNQFKLSSVQITAAFAYRAGTVGIALNLVTQDNFEEAIRFAQKCDQLRRQTNKKNWCFGDAWDMDKFFPPLFGIPISIKDTIDLEGFASTIGLIARSNRLKKDGSIMECIKKSNMIPFVKTNIPQCAMTMESNNFLWGRAQNPWNRKRAVGGSTGGQGGLIAVRGSPLGVGSDLAGSLRIPAQFCGICSLKPNSSRLSFQGHTPYIKSVDGAKVISPVLGPLARSINDLALWLKVATNQQFYGNKLDPYVKLFPFNDQKYLSVKNHKYKIAYLYNLDTIQTTPASQRAVKQTISIINDLGHDLIQIKIPNEQQLILAVFKQITGQGNLQSYRKMLQGQSFIPEYQKMAQLLGLNSCLYCIISVIKNKTQPRVGKIVNSLSRKTVYQYLQNAGDIKNYKEQWMKFISQNNIDFVICPGFGSQACLHQQSKNISLTGAYTFIWNALDVPVGAMPVTIVKDNQQNYESKHHDEITEALKANAWGSQGLPVGIQIIGMPYQQEKVLGFMKIMEEKIRFNQKYPGPKI